MSMAGAGAIPLSMTGVSVLVSRLNSNSTQSTLACVRSLLVAKAASPVTCVIRVIDNGSREEEGAALRDAPEVSGIHLYRSASNLGFAESHNIALCMAIAPRPMPSSSGW